MSHLHEILNYDPARPQESRSNDQSGPRVDQLEVSSSAEDDPSPGSDDEIDELDDESDGDMDYDEEEPIPPTPIGTSTEPPPDTPSSHSQESTHNHKTEPAPDAIPLRKAEKRPEPVPRRKLEKHDRKIDLGLHDHKAHADCPDTLACLPDTTGRPQHTLPVILRCAILGSPRKRLTIREIYATMEAKYPYYKSAGQTWKQSVRHHLSLNRLFERQPRPVTDPGFGSYWTVNLSAPPGTKRPRKRGRPNKDGAEVSTSKKIPPKNQSQPVQLQLVQPPPLKYQFQPQTHPPPPLPPLSQPQVNAMPSRSPRSHQDMQTVALHSPPLPQYHSPSGTHQSSQAPMTLQLPPPPPSPRSQTHQNQHQNHQQQHRGRSYHPSNSVPPSQMAHPPSLSPSISLQPPPTASGHHHNHYPHHSQPSQQQQQQQNYHPHQRPNQEHHTQYTSPPQHPAQQSPIGPPLSRHSFNHSHVQPHLEHHENRRQSVSHPPQRKVSSGPPRSSARETTYKHSSRGSESDDVINPVIRNAPTISSDDEHDSDEDMDQPYQPLQSKVFIPTKPSPLYSLPPYSTLTPLRREELLEQMRQEIATLRRSSAEAVSTSIRLSEQLANANLEVSRSREAVRDLEDMLQDEAAKRREAEKIRMAEIERRRAPEDTLSTSTIRSPTRIRGT